MSMYIEVWSKDVSFHGDGDATEGTVNLIGWPFNVDVSEAGNVEVSAEGMITAGPPEQMMPLECERNKSYVTVHFPEPIQDRESMVVRLRVKMFI